MNEKSNAEKVKQNEKTSVKDSAKSRDSQTKERSKTGKKEPKEPIIIREHKSKTPTEEVQEPIEEDKMLAIILDESDDISEEKNLSMEVQDETSQHFRTEDLEDYNSKPDEDFEYADDDFENYDDDFEDDNEDEIEDDDDENEEEEDQQVDEERQEKKLDSGVYDLESKHKRSLRIKEMEEVKVAMQRENSSQVKYSPSPHPTYFNR